MGVYRWNETARFSGDAQIVGEWLEGIDERTPDRIVDEARASNCPGHKYFTWDDPKAADHWRKQEARFLVNSIVTVSDADDREPIEIPAFESVVIDDQRQYILTMERVLVSGESPSDDDIWRQIAGEGAASIKAIQDKLGRYSYLRREQAEDAQKHLDLARKSLTG